MSGYDDVMKALEDLKASMVQRTGQEDMSLSGLNYVAQPVTDMSAYLPDKALIFAMRGSILRYTYGGSGAPAIDSSQAFGFVDHVCNADTDYVEADFWITAGDYRVRTYGYTSNASGKVDVYIDGVLLEGGTDWYSGSTVKDVAKFTTALATLTTGKHTVKLLMNGKNGSSSSYRLYLTYIVVSRT